MHILTAGGMRNSMQIMDLGRKYTVEFTNNNDLKYTHLGKTYAKRTQAVVKRGDKILGVGEVIKHHNDEDDTLFARRLALKKALIDHDPDSHGLLLWKEIRTEFWKKLILIS
jgi:hypothetical protein